MASRTIFMHLLLSFGLFAGACAAQEKKESPDLPAGNGGSPTDPAVGKAGAPGVDLNPTQPSSMGAAGAATPRQPERRTIDRTAGVLTAGEVSALERGGNAGNMLFLYPYDKTVFPAGILPPLLQWRSTGGAPDGVYVHISSQFFDYREVFGAQAGSSVPVPADAWAAAAEQSQGEQDVATVTLTTISGGVVSGPIQQTWTFARGQLKSAVYYNTYNSSLVAPNNGAVMRILPLQAQPEVIKTALGVVPVGPCYSCHSMSANGQMLVAQRHQYPGGPYTSNSFDVAKNPSIDPPPLAQSSAGTEDWGFSAVYPDGSKLLTAGQPAATDSKASFPFAPQNLPAMLGPREAKLVDTSTGKEIPSTGLVKYANMPAFSPDGTKVVFNDYDNGSGHSLSMMSFDDATKAFSSRVEIYRDPVLFPGWPNFTPDGKKVIFALGNGSDYATVQDPPTGLIVNRSHLVVVDLATRQVTALDRASGTQLPQRDQELSYYPTVSPVAAGGYFWIFFTSRRTYGNVMTQPERDPVTKKLWVAALDIDSDVPGGDISHPAFYLPGQELTAGNMRAFATLTPCKAVGGACASGVDCCGGFCVDGTCSDSTPSCAQVEDKCATSADCCAGGGLSCIGGRCASVVR